MRIEDIKIKPSRRNKRIIVRLTDGELVATVPYNMSKSEVIEILKKDKEKLQKIFDKSLSQAKKKTDTLYEGYEITFLGKNYKVKFTQSGIKPIIKGNNILINSQYKAAWKNIFKYWYKQEAEKYFNQLLMQYSKLMGVQYCCLRLSEAKSKWGSCSRRDHKITIVWRLIMAPPWVIKYIVVHELAHIRHPNHQAEFWAFVKQFYPEYKEAEKWLKLYGGNLFV